MARDPNGSYTSKPWTQIIHGGDGSDDFRIRVDNFLPYAVHKYYGDEGSDYFIINGINRFYLENQIGNKMLVSGGSGFDIAILDIKIGINFNLNSLGDHIKFSSIDYVRYDFSIYNCTIEGTDRPENTMIGSYSGESFCNLGLGNDVAEFAAINSIFNFHGGGGRDLLDAYSLKGGVTRVYGDQGSDVFVFDEHFAARRKVHIMDFERGSDKILIDLGDSIPSFERELTDGHFSRHKFKTIIDFDPDNGSLYVNGNMTGQIEGVSVLSASDFLFV